MKIKNSTSLIFFLILYSAGSWVQEIRSDQNKPFDINAELDDPATGDFLDNTNFSIDQQFDPGKIVSLLVQLINAPCLISQNLYVHTYPLNKKSIIDIPAFFPYREYSRPRTFGMSPYFNQTSRMFFNEKCDGIQAYLAVCNPVLLQRLADCVDCVKPVYPKFDIDPLTIFPLFANIAVQERQLGVMFHGDKYYKRLTIHVHVPIIYLERNYYLTPQERTCIENAFGQSAIAESCEGSMPEACDCGSTCGSCQEDNRGQSLKAENPVDFNFIREHLVSDKFGIDDTRIHLDVDLCKYPNYKFALGAVLTLPTAFAFKKGLLGNSFAKNCKTPNLDLTTIVGIAASGNAEQAKLLGANFMLGALDQLSNQLLDAPLGYGKHLGLGLSFNTKSRLSAFIKRPWAHHVKMRGRMIVQYYLPAMEDRFC